MSLVERMKRETNKPWKSEIDTMIRRWLDAVVSASNDAGFEGDSLLARFIEYGGEPPRSTGRDQSNLTMMLAIRMLRNPHPDYVKINPIMRVMIRRLPHYASAILAKHFYLGLCARTNQPWNDEERARSVAQSINQYRSNMDCAYRFIAEKLEFLNEVLSEADLTKNSNRH